MLNSMRAKIKILFKKSTKMPIKSNITTTNNKPDHLYRKGVGIMMINQDQKIFVGKRIDNKSDAWQMPQGGLDHGESEDEAMFRELKEETGTNNVKILQMSKEYHYYNLPYKLQKKFWGGKYLGQKQQWYLTRFLGVDNQINIDTNEPEFSSWKWMDKNEVIDHIVPFKRDLYVKLINEFINHL